MDVEGVMRRVGLAFDPEIGTYAHEKTGIPLTVWFDKEAGEVVLLDQVRLPYEVKTWRSNDWRRVALEGIKGMVVRGSQAIGCAAGYASLLASKECEREQQRFLERFKEILGIVRGTRPTAYPLTWALDLALEAATQAWEEGLGAQGATEAVGKVADFVLMSDLTMNWFLRQEGKAYLRSGDTVITHCNGGSLSSSFGGHALGVVEEAFAEGVDLTLVAKETRPRCQGYKLTVWELNRAGVPVIIITDNMVTAAFRRFGVSKAMLGVDRVTRDGYVANKVGSADLAYIADTHGVPFYYATSYSTIDLERDGHQVPIEERDVEEVTYFYQLEAEELRRRGITSPGSLLEWPPRRLLEGKPRAGRITVFNPAFDLTPPQLIDAIITDVGVLSPLEVRMLTKAELNERVRRRLAEWGIEYPIGLIGNDFDRVRR